MDFYDVIIIGGGPTGLSAAITTSKSDLTTLVLEEHPTIGKPLACGEGISLGKLTTLNNAPRPGSYLSENQLSLQHQKSFIEREITIQRFFFGEKGVATSHLRTLTINRPLFDQIMAKNAEKSGTTIKVASRVVKIKKHDKDGLIVTTNSEEYHTNLVIGCDGPSAHSVKMMKLSPPHSYVQGIEYKLEGVHTDALDFYFDFRQFPKMHYGWVFPKRNETNIGVVVDPVSNPKKILDSFTESILGDIKRLKINREIAGIIPSSGAIPKMFTNNYLVAGDAAGLTNSIFYGGIAIGIHSGELAAQTAIEAYEAHDFTESKLENYQKVCMTMPYNDPIIQEAHKVLYNRLTPEELELFGSLINGWDITTLSSYKKLKLFIKAGLHPSLIRNIKDGKIVAYGFSKSRDWGF
ncbi:MAG: NAD(P)/FAD-dependent oxidoreductase [Candidatus Hodarchaeales archaeon]